MLPISIKLSDEFYKEEYRNDYLVTKDIKELWAVELDLLVKFDEVCKKYGIQYWLDSGTLLGAVRHKGFIPWDDDIDVVIMRRDYEKLLNVASEFKEPYLLQSAYTDKDYPRGHLQLRNSKTCMMLPKEAEIVEFNQGISLDIFILDGITTDKSECKKWFISIRKYKKLLKELAYRNKSLIYKLRAYFIKFIYGDAKRLSDQLNEIALLHCDSEYIDKIMFRNKPNEIKVLRKDYFYNTLYYEFEGRSFPVPCGYDEILKVYYGDDYMTPANVMSGHGEVIINTRLSYQEVLRRRE